MDENKRGSFGSTIGFLLSAIGSAVGLGNIWGFPYKMGRCGGFTFLIVYLALAAFVGFAIMLSEPPSPSVRWKGTACVSYLMYVVRVLVLWHNCAREIPST